MAYLSKWDIENIELIIAAKSLGRTLEQTEAYLVSSQHLPVSISATTIPMSELKALLLLPDLEAVINLSLVKFGYGAVLLQQLGDFRKSGDLGIFSSALQNYYYSKLFSELRFLQGDEEISGIHQGRSLEEKHPEFAKVERVKNQRAFLRST